VAALLLYFTPARRGGGGRDQRDSSAIGTKRGVALTGADFENPF